MADFLADPATHGGAAVERIDTHTAVVIMAGDRAWKLRRPVDYGFLDYSTRTRRWDAARREIALNDRTAPGLCIGIAMVAGEPGAFRLDPPETADTTAEPVVLMNRFDGRDLFDRMAEDGRLTTTLLRATGRAVGAMHKAAEAVPSPIRLPDFATNEATQLTDLAPVLGPGVLELAQQLREAGANLGPIAARRPCRRCHGDLHLRNIVLWRGRPAPFDGIDFNDAISDIDPLYDLAFLLMDLQHRGHAELKSAVFNAWAEAMAGNPGAQEDVAYAGLALLPFYQACRAAIRAKVDGLGAAKVPAEARGAIVAEAQEYLDQAHSLLSNPRQPCLLAVGGLSGSGKSTLAHALASKIGAVVLRTDAIRKGLQGVAETERLPPEAYSRDASDRVYDTLLRRAGMALSGNATVILDAAHLRAQERDRAESLAAEHGAAFAGLWLDAPLHTLRDRVEERRGDVSDATPHVVTVQSGYDLGPIHWHRLDAATGADAVAATAIAHLPTTPRER